MIFWQIAGYFWASERRGNNSEHTNIVFDILSERLAAVEIYEWDLAISSEAYLDRNRGPKANWHTAHRNSSLSLDPLRSHYLHLSSSRQQQRSYYCSPRHRNTLQGWQYKDPYKVTDVAVCTITALQSTRRQKKLLWTGTRIELVPRLPKSVGFVLSCMSS